MPYPLPLTRTEAYLAYKAGVIQQSDLKPSLAVPRNGIDAWLAYWTGLAEDYPKREDGTPHILQEEEAYIAYLCGVINEYPEKCLRRVGAYLRYLITARWGRPDHPLNREELYLSLIKTQFIPSGDPSSDIVIDGTAKAPFVDVKLYGDTYQQTYSGKNLFQLNGSTSEKGLTISRNTTTGAITFDGTTTGTYPWLNNAGASLPAGTYTFSIDHTLPYALYLRFYETSSSYPKIATISAGNTKATVTTTYTTIHFAMLYGIASAGTQVPTTTIYPMLESGSSVTSFEPYVGGVPSPNPDYPQPIQTVTGEQTVTVVGKNLFDKDNMDIRNGYLYNTTFSYRTTNADRAFIVPCEPNTTYTISRSVITSSFRAAYIDLEPSEIPADASSETRLTCAGYIANNSGTSITITTSATAKSLLVHYGNTNTDGVTLIGQSVATIMVEKSASTTTYAPYSKQAYEINLGKNLFDKNNYSDQTGYYIGSNGIWRSGGASDHYFVFRVEPNTTYTFSKNAQASNNRFRVGISSGEPTVGVAFSIWGGGDTATEITLTTASDSKYAYVYYSVTVNVQEAIQSLQIEAGSHKTSYAPYFTPIELCKLGEYQDYIYKDGDDWKIHKAIKKFQMADTTLWVKKGDGQFYSEFWADRNEVRAESGFCSHFIYSPTVWSGVGYGISSAGNLWLTTGDTTLTGIALFQTWLNTKKPILYQPLTTATDTTITDSNLIAQLEALVKGGSEEGTTYIKVSASDPNLPGLLYVEAAEYI